MKVITITANIFSVMITITLHVFEANHDNNNDNDNGFIPVKGPWMAKNHWRNSPYNDWA